MKDITFVNVSGFFSSGSSAMVDLLKEFNGFYEANAEIRFVRDPYGIVQLEHALVGQWEFINSSAAISDFLDVMKKSCRNKKGLFAPMGFGLRKNIDSRMMDITRQYVDELTDYTYKFDFYHYKLKKPYLKYIIDRYRWAIEYLTNGKLKTANRNIETCYFAHPTQEQFNEATKRYFERMFDSHAGDGKTFIILDQAISPNNTQVIHRYFNKAKMLVIDRDPRDMYVDDLQWGENLDRDYQTREAAMRYVRRERMLRSNIMEDADIKRVRFEELIVDYDQKVPEILQFLGLDASDHLHKKKFLKPEKSIKNIGIWRKYYKECKAAIDCIEQELPDLLYDSSHLYNSK